MNTRIIEILFKNSLRTLEYGDTIDDHPVYIKSVSRFPQTLQIFGPVVQFLQKSNLKCLKLEGYAFDDHWEITFRYQGFEVKHTCYKEPLKLPELPGEFPTEFAKALEGYRPVRVIISAPDTEKMIARAEFGKDGRFFFRVPLTIQPIAYQHPTRKKLRPEVLEVLASKYLDTLCLFNLGNLENYPRFFFQLPDNLLNLPIPFGNVLKKVVRKISQANLDITEIQFLAGKNSFSLSLRAYNYLAKKCIDLVLKKE